MKNVTMYCNLVEFNRSYRLYHGYLSILVCVFGSVANVLNICVLTRKEMRIPTNFILTGLAVADLLVMLEYLPFASHVYLDPNARMRGDYFLYPWTLYMYFHALFTQVCHFTACCLTVILAVWRYIAITHPQNNKVWCNPKRTKIAILMSYIFCPFICTPLFLALKIGEVVKPIYSNGTLIPDKLQNTTVAAGNVTLYVTRFDESYKDINFWVYSVVIKLLPCILLTILSVFLIKALLVAKKRWKNLCNTSGVPLVNGDVKKQRNLEKEQQADRTTRMLLAVLLLFLMTEFPQAMLGVLSVILGNDFCNSCYIPLGDLMDIIALTNSAINFILYCSMSQQFRSAFCEVVVSIFRLKRNRPPRLKGKCANTEITQV